MTVSTSRKKVSGKEMAFKNFSPIAGMKDSFKNTFPLDRKKKKLSQAGVSEKNIKNG